MSRFWILVLAAAAGVTPARAFDVGFADIPYYIKTRLSGPEKRDFEFFFCRVGRDNDEKGECLRLSSCTYPDDSVASQVKKIGKPELKQEFELLTQASYQARAKSSEYLKTLLALLSALDEKRECLLVTHLEWNDKLEVTAKFRFPLVQDK